MSQFGFFFKIAPSFGAGQSIIKKMAISSKEKRNAYKKAYMKAYEYKDKEKRNAYLKAYLKDYEKKRKPRDRKMYQKAYRLAHPEKVKLGYRKHQALKRGTMHEQYATNYIFERDGWMCGICGRKINKKLKYPNPLSKSIDHIVPLSKGGNDSPANVQAAHLRCNVGKQATNKGQLRLFG